jgi:hypothetical protein
MWVALAAITLAAAIGFKGPRGRPPSNSRRERPVRNPSSRPDMLSRKPWLLAIARRLATEYTAVREPVPERLAALLKKLEGPSAVSPSTPDRRPT